MESISKVKRSIVFIPTYYYLSHPLFFSIAEKFSGYEKVYLNPNDPSFQRYNKGNIKKEEILNLPLDDNGHEFCKEHPISDCKIPHEAKILIGFWLTESQTSSSRYPLSKSRGGNWTDRKRSLVANQVELIKHWKVEKKSYDEITNQEATWFVDPPYVQAGKRYRKNTIDYSHLATWCQERKGQTIVCEQSGADWLDFSTFKKNTNASNKKYEEVVWINPVPTK